MNHRLSPDAGVRRLRRDLVFARGAAREERRWRGGQSGAALLMVLVFTGLLSLVLVAALMRSTKSVEMASLNEGREEALGLANTAWRCLVENLRGEIRAGSKSPEYGSEAAAVAALETDAGLLKYYFYYPAAPLNAVPCPTSTAANLPPNLLKWSTRNAAFFGDSGGRTYPFKDKFPAAREAAAVSTEDVSLNGIKVSLQRWNLPLLLPKKDKAESSTNTLPDFLGAPDWILLSRSGEARRDLDMDATDPVVGRYAYTIYNEGGLLDLNTAGVPSEVDPRARAFKGTLRLADLTPILEESGFKGAEQKDFADALLKWRDASLVQDVTFPFNYLNDLLLHPLSSLGRVVPGHWCGARKCLRCFPHVIDTGVAPMRGQANNRAISGRWELTQKVLSQNIGSLGARQNFLQYVGTFSRSLDQPSLTSPQPTGSGVVPPKLKAADADGNTEATWDSLHPSHADHLNPPFLQVRVKHEFRRADKTWAFPGDPLVRRRFAVTHLAEVGVDAVGAFGTGSRPEALFGLGRVKTTDPWYYIGERILTLGEVADLPEEAAREPNFMELLKAAIYAGVLAGGPSPWGDDRQEWENSLDCAVIQIAANLIDQYDADSFPTRIVMPLATGDKEFRGIEALPYLHGVQTHMTVTPPDVSPLPSPYTPVGAFTSVPVVAGTVLLWQTMALWNPHVIPKVSNASGIQVNAVSQPESFALEVSSNVKFQVQPYLETQYYSGPYNLRVPLTSSLAKTELDFRVPPRVPVGRPQVLYFNWSSGLPDLFEHPVWLSDADPSAQAMGAVADAANSVSAGTISAVAIAKLPRVFRGIVPRPSSTVMGGTFMILPSVYKVSPQPLLTYKLKYRDSASNWITYDEKTLQLGAELRIDSVDWSRTSTSGTYSASIFPDPRTERWGSVSVSPGTFFGYENVPWFTGVPDASRVLPDPVPDADGLYRRPSGALSPGAWLPNDQDSARPRLLNRQFRSVGEMAFAFAGAPWRQVDFATPESGFGGLLDVFCISELEDLEPLKSGRLDLNTRQLPVLKAMLSGTGWNVDAEPFKQLSFTERDGIAQMFLNRTKSKPMRNVSELVGFWSPKTSGATAGVGADFYDGFAKDLLNVTLNLEGGAQYKQAAVRALADAGQTRVWNLMLDVIVQSGRYPQGLRPLLSQFVVTGETRVWVHVALDRLTGEVLDTQVEYPQE